MKAEIKREKRRGVVTYTVSHPGLKGFTRFFVYRKRHQEALDYAQWLNELYEKQQHALNDRK